MLRFTSTLMFQDTPHFLLGSKKEKIFFFTSTLLDPFQTIFTKKVREKVIFIKGKKSTSLSKRNK